MATQKQIEANRRNAQLSTGPRTPEGKSKSRLNALRDGVTGQVITLSAEDLPVFNTLKADLIADLAPKTVMELRLASAIAWDTWRLDRIRAVEMNLFALGAANSRVEAESADPGFQSAISNAAAFSTEAHKFDLLSTYEQRLSRSLHKNIAALRALQAERREHAERDLAAEVLIARHCEVKGQAYKAPATPTENGSVFATEQVIAAARRKSTLEVARRTVAAAPVVINFPVGNEDKPGPRGPAMALKVAAAA